MPKKYKLRAVITQCDPNTPVFPKMITTFCVHPWSIWPKNVLEMAFTYEENA